MAAHFEFYGKIIHNRAYKFCRKHFVHVNNSKMAVVLSVEVTFDLLKTESMELYTQIREMRHSTILHNRPKEQFNHRSSDEICIYRLCQQLGYVASNGRISVSKFRIDIHLRDSGMRNRNSLEFSGITEIIIYSVFLIFLGVFK